MNQLQKSCSRHLAFRNCFQAYLSNMTKLQRLKLCTSLILLQFCYEAKSQLTFNDLYTIVNSFTNPYLTNQRTYRDAIDSLQVKGYVLTEYNRVLATAPATGRTDAFTVENTANPNEQLRMVSVFTRLNNVNTVSYSINLSTTDLNQYNQILKIVRSHPDFVRTVNSEINFSDIYTSKPTIGERQRIVFTISSTGDTQTGVKASKPFTYQIMILRMQP